MTLSPSGHKDCSLDLKRKDTNTSVGRIIVRLESTQLGVTRARNDLSNLQKDVVDAGIGDSGAPGMLPAIEAEGDIEDLVEQTDGLALLGTLCSRLNQLKPESLKPFIDAIDEISKVCVYRQ